MLFNPLLPWPNNRVQSLRFILFGLQSWTHPLEHFIIVYGCMLTSEKGRWNWCAVEGVLSGKAWTKHVRGLGSNSGSKTEKQMQHQCQKRANDFKLSVSHPVAPRAESEKTEAQEGRQATFWRSQQLGTMELETVAHVCLTPLPHSDPSSLASLPYWSQWVIFNPLLSLAASQFPDVGGLFFFSSFSR